MGELRPGAYQAIYMIVKRQMNDSLRFRQWGERARLAGGRSGETRGIGRWSGGVLGRVAAVP